MINLEQILNNSLVQVTTTTRKAVFSINLSGIEIIN